MAYTTGTATNYLDLMDKLRTFATTDASLVSAGEEWATERWTGGNELILRGQGLPGTEEIYVGFKGVFDTPGDYFNWDCRGFTGYDSGMAFETQPGASGARYLSLWNSSIPYWFVANGQRIIVVAKISTTYHVGYFGYWYPYGQPSAFPYPLLIAASTGDAAVRWSSTVAWHSSMIGGPTSSSASGVASAGTTFYDVSGAWGVISCNVRYTSYADIAAALYPWGHNNGGLTSMDVCPDGTYAVLPAVLMQYLPASNLLGELDGVFWTTGQALAAEDILTIGGVSHLVVPNIFRSGRGDYCAIKLA